MPLSPPYKQASHLLTIAYFFVLPVLALTTNACGHFDPLPAPVSRKTVLQAEHDYKCDQQSLASWASASVPDETAEQYSVRSLLGPGDFAKLEKIAQLSLMEKRRLLSGVWKTNAFFRAVSFPVPRGDLKYSDYQFPMATVKRWIASIPDSATARIAFPSTDSNYGSFARELAMPTRSRHFSLRDKLHRHYTIYFIFAWVSS